MSERHASEHPLRRRLVALCFVAQNCAMGFAFSSFGPLLAANEQHFGISRTVASTGMSLVTLAIGSLSPVIGSLMQRTSARLGMIAGALLSAGGYWGLALSHSFLIALVMYALIGTGVCLTAIIGPLILVSRWFEGNRARVLSLVNLPIVLFVTPYAIAELLPLHGRLVVLGAIGTVFLLLAPALGLLSDHPPRSATQSVQPLTDSPPAAAGAATRILGEPAFWLLSLGIGIMAGAGSGFMVHIVPFGIQRQLSLPAAAALLSVYSGCGILGTLLFGWIADRLGPPGALVISAVCQALLWWGLLEVDGPLLYVLAGLLGICVVPLITLHGAALSQLFGPSAIGRAVGYSYAVQLPFIFSFAPAMGWLFDALGNYRLAFLLMAGLMALASVSFYLLLVNVLRRSAAGVSEVSIR